MLTYEVIRQDLNKVLPKDVRVFSVLPVANRFDAKTNTSDREYSYFLPTFMLTKISEMNLESPPKTLKADESQTKIKVVEDDGEEGYKVLHDVSHISFEF